MLSALFVAIYFVSRYDLNAQADLSLRCALMSFCLFCHAVAQICIADFFGSWTIIPILSDKLLALNLGLSMDVFWFIPTV